jgi:hypothetical protein
VTLEELASKELGLTSLPHGDKIRIFGWWLHTYGKLTHIKPRDINGCYLKLNLAQTNVSSMLDWLASKDVFLKSKDGYRLERSAADKITSQYGQRAATVHVERLLTELPARVPNIKQRDYLDETLICLRNGAFRATVVMAWNLAYDHLCEWILVDATRLAEFNAQTPKSFPKTGYPTVTKRDDFLDYSEAHVLQIAKSSRVITGNLNKILKEKLDRRNLAAHPSGVKIIQATAEEVIRDLVENVILNLT